MTFIEAFIILDQGLISAEFVCKDFVEIMTKETKQND